MGWAMAWWSWTFVLRARASGLTTAKTSALSPQAVVELFTLLHQHRTDERRPCSASWPRLRCVRPAGRRSTWCAAAT